jgi:hypothetical protein
MSSFKNSKLKNAKKIQKRKSIEGKGKNGTCCAL